MKFLKRCKNEIGSLCTDCATELMVNRVRYKRPVSMVMFIITLLNMMAMTFATGGNEDIVGLRKSIVTIISDIYSSVFVIVTVLAALLLVIAFVVRMTSNQQRAAQATQWITRILICYVAINCIGVIFKVIENVTDGMGFEDKYASDYPGTKPK